MAMQMAQQGRCKPECCRTERERGNRRRDRGVGQTESWAFTPLQWELELPQQICTALAFSVYKNLLKHLIKFRLLSPIPRNSHSLGSGWQPQICAFKKILRMTNVLLVPGEIP